MSPRISPPVRSFIPAAVLLAVVGWGGLVWTIFSSRPDAGMRWVLFFVLMLAFTGTTMPFIAFLNRRFPSVPPTTSSVIVRQALWVGIYVATLVWLQSGRVLSPAIALLLGVGFLFIESLLRLRERAHWRPES